MEILCTEWNLKVLATEEKKKLEFTTQYQCFKQSTTDAYRGAANIFSLF